MDKKNFSEKTVFSIYSPTDLTKRWFLSYYDNDGTRQRVYGTINAGKTYEERLRAAEALKKQYEKAAKGIKPTLGDYEAILEYLTNLNLRKKSFQTSKSKLDVLFRFLAGRKLSKDLVTAFFNDIRRDKYETTYNNYVTKIRQLLRAIGKDSMMEGIEHIRERRRPANYFQKHHVKKLAAAIQEQDPELWLFVQFMYYCFIRPNELRHLRACNVMVESNQIFIPAEVSKNGKGEYVSIPQAFQAKVKFIDAMPANELLFPADRDITKPCSVNKMYLRHSKILKLMGFGKGYTLYSWKHTGAVHAVKAGVGVKDLQIQLRHHSLDQVDEYLRQMGVHDLKRLQEIFPEI